MADVTEEQHSLFTALRLRLHWRHRWTYVGYAEERPNRWTTLGYDNVCAICGKREYFGFSASGQNAERPPEEDRSKRTAYSEKSS